MDLISKLTAKKHKLYSHAAVKTVKTVLGLVVDRRFLATITWSGKTLPGRQKKISFESHKEIVNFIHSVALRNHVNYSWEEYKKDMIDKVFKTAYK